MAKRTVTTAYSLPSAHLRHSLRLALVSDIHERPPEDIIALLRHKRPDLILITGDTFERRDSEAETFRIKHEGAFRRAVINAAMKYNSVMMKVIDRHNLPSAEATYEFLAKAAKLAPIFLSLGNHEQRLTDDDHRFLSEHHITLLDNDDADVCVKGETLHIGGLSTVPDEEWLSDFAKKDGFKLLLCHHPEYFDPMVADKAIDLTLSGHNHGGQIRVFGKGIFSSRSGLLPKYDRGIYHQRLIVSAGCSNPVAVPRLGNPFELVMIDLNPQ